MFSDELKATLAENPELLLVYVNEASEWSFNPRSGFDTTFNREDILAEISETAPAKINKKDKN